MPTFKRAGPEVAEMAKEIISEVEEHSSLRNGVKIDFVFAFPDYDETTGEPINDALKKNGVKALGIARKLPLKDRAMGRGDAEIALDGHEWGHLDESEKRAFLDHELTHLVATEKRDDLGRPIIKLRKHDFEVGWFASVAKRHSIASQERKQAIAVMESHGQFFWPEIANQISGKTGKALSRLQHLEA